MALSNARKRRRLNTQESLDGDEAVDHSDDSHFDPIDDGAGPVRSHSPHNRPEAQKPRRRIHIVRHTKATDDEFFSQLPTGSQNPHCIRGAHWQRPLLVSPSRPPLPAVSVDVEENDGLSTAFDQSSSESRVLPIPTRGAASSENPPLAGSFATVEPTSANGMISAADEAALLDEFDDFPMDTIPPSVESRPAIDSTAVNATSEENDFQFTANRSFTTARPSQHTNLRQTTLFGLQKSPDDSSNQATQTQRPHNWPLMNSNEKPTHHELQTDALQTWVYPLNLGAVRDYQYNIVSRGLFSNLLVALPTGLGKTFIAAAIMLNWFRWTKNAQIVFVAPTRPLVAQQVSACFGIAGIPRSATSLLTGNVSPGLRAIEWAEKRVFFMTPQTIVNDLKTGICDPKRIVLLVVDEAHRATGNYAYVEVVRFIRRFNESFRVLALTATPGSTIETVQEVIDGLGISRTEIRTEDSLDIRQYVHQRNIDTMLFDYSEDTQFVMDLLSAAIKPVLQIVTGMSIYWSKDPMSLTAFGCMQARQKWMASPAGRGASFGLKGKVNSVLTTLASVAHAIDLLKFHGIGPFYNKILAFQDEEPEGRNKGSKYKKEIVQSQDFKTMISTVKQWISKEDFLGHPKLEYLSQVVLNHFIDAGDGRGVEPDISPAATRVMIFAHFRDSAEEIVRVLKRHDPLVRPHVFVGQAASRMNEGMDQKKQQSIIDDFKKGVYNTLVATSIGEEGLDIGQVDLIICYDASASPIRMLQRMGRTGRKRAGNIVVLLMKNKEQANFEKAKDNYEKMQQMIAKGTSFKYHIELSPRIVPRGTNPQVDQRMVEIPIENSQADGELPEPKKKGRAPKRPPKKFHMPDGVITGFLKASEVGKETGGDGPVKHGKSPNNKKLLVPEPLPDPNEVLLTHSQQEDLERKYLDIAGEEEQVVEFPRLDRFTELQRQERPSKLVGHSSAAWRMIGTLNAMHDMDEARAERFKRNLRDEDKSEADAALEGRSLLWDDEPEPLMSKRRSVTGEVDLSTPLRRSSSTKPNLNQTRKTMSSAAAKQRKAKVKAKQHSNNQRGKFTRRTPVLSSSVAGSEGPGIDLMNTDEEHEHDDSNEDGDGYDDDSDLLDFIDDGTPVEEPSSSSSPPLTFEITPKRRKNKKKQEEEVGSRRRSGFLRRRRRSNSQDDHNSNYDVVGISQATDEGFLPDVETLLRDRSSEERPPAASVHKRRSPSPLDTNNRKPWRRGRGPQLFVDDSDE